MGSGRYWNRLRMREDLKGNVGGFGVLSKNERGGGLCSYVTHLSNTSMYASSLEVGMQWNS